MVSNRFYVYQSGKFFEGYWIEELEKEKYFRLANWYCLSEEEYLIRNEKLSALIKKK